VAQRRAWIPQSLGASLIPIDPDSGQLGPPIPLGRVYRSDVREADLRFGRLWLWGSDWGAPDELPWAVLDLQTSRFLHTHEGLQLSPALPVPAAK